MTNLLFAFLIIAGLVFYLIVVLFLAKVIKSAGNKYDPLIHRRKDTYEDHEEMEMLREDTH